jgi:hypothetical protein
MELLFITRYLKAMRNTPYPVQFIETEKEDTYYMPLHNREKTANTTKILSDDQELEVCRHEYHPENRAPGEPMPPDMVGWGAVVIDSSVIEHAGTHLMEAYIPAETKPNNFRSVKRWSKNAPINKVYLKFSDSVKTLNHRLTALCYREATDLLNDEGDFGQKEWAQNSDPSDCGSELGGYEGGDA